MDACDLLEEDWCVVAVDVLVDQVGHLGAVTGVLDVPSGT